MFYIVIHTYMHFYIRSHFGSSMAEADDDGIIGLAITFCEHLEQNNELVLSGSGIPATVSRLRRRTPLVTVGSFWAVIIVVSALIATRFRCFSSGS